MEYINVIYMYTNKINGHKYIGQSIDFKKRHGEHCRGADVRHNSLIDKAFLKYGKDNFDIHILASAPNMKGDELKDFLNEMEKYYIWKFNTFKDKNHYNLSEGGNLVSVRCGKNNHNYGKMKGKTNPFYGRTHTDATKEKISKANKGRKCSEREIEVMMENRNTTGFFKVCKCSNNKLKKGYDFKYYQMDDNGNRRKFSSTDLFKLKSKVENEGLPWKVLNMDKAVATVRNEMRWR